MPVQVDSVHYCVPFDYEQWLRDNPPAASKWTGELDVGEPRTVRMIYFLPNDRPFRQDVVDSMKTTIQRIQTFYAEQMLAHGFGDMTFRFETGAQGDPLVHRVDGEHADSYYHDSTHSGANEVAKIFDPYANIDFVILDISSFRGPEGGGKIGKNGGTSFLAYGQMRFGAHELGHAFGLHHDFNNGGYVMSYGPGMDRLSACHAEFLSVHPYFNPESSFISDMARLPTVELISLPSYQAGATSVNIQLKVKDSEGLHQVLLLSITRRPHSAAGNYEVKACRGLAGKRDSVVDLEYDGVNPSSLFSSLSDPVSHLMRVEVVNSEGDVGHTDFVLSEISPNLIATLEGHRSEVNSVAFSPDGATMASSGLWDREIKLWNVATREEIATLAGYPQGFLPLAFSPDDAILASGVSDGRVLLWDTSEWVQPRPFRLIEISGDGQQGAPGAALERPPVVEARDQYDNPLPDVPGTFSSTAGDGTLGGNFTIERPITDTSGRVEVSLTLGPGPGTNTVEVSPGGRTLKTFHAEDVGNGVIVPQDDIRTWHLPDGAIARLGKGGISGGDLALDLSKDGRYLAVASAIGVWVFESASGRAAMLLPAVDVKSVSFSPDGATLASTGWGEIELWHVETGTRIGVLSREWLPFPIALISPDGATLALK